MTSAIARLNQTVSEVIAAYGGVRPVEQGEGDSFVAAFARASDAVACALELQFEVDESTGVVHHEVRVSLLPNWLNGTQLRHSKLDGDHISARRCTNHPHTCVETGTRTPQRITTLRAELWRPVAGHL